jgi:5'-3' exoribonuclease 2
LEAHEKLACRYVHQRLNFHPGWRNLTVVLSDANTPGEGEHKFSQFIREQRARPGWNPNTWHCVYGLDADLIHLALATHEPHYYILREVVFFQDKRGVRRGCGDGNNGVNGSQQEPGGASQKPSIAKKPYQFLKIDTLREYLTLEFQDLRLPFEFNPERVIDDFVFMCFFVGNDFLPHMPTLDIREEGIELMLHVYREVLPQLPGYVVSGAYPCSWQTLIALISQACHLLSASLCFHFPLHMFELRQNQSLPGLIASSCCEDLFLCIVLPFFRPFSKFRVCIMRN